MISLKAAILFMNRLAIGCISNNNLLLLKYFQQL